MLAEIPATSATLLCAAMGDSAHLVCANQEIGRTAGQHQPGPCAWTVGLMLSLPFPRRELGRRGLLRMDLRAACHYGKTSHEITMASGQNSLRKKVSATMLHMQRAVRMTRAKPAHAWRGTSGRALGHSEGL
jgi:hypothetical protein